MDQEPEEKAGGMEKLGEEGAGGREGTAPSPSGHSSHSPCL